MDVDPSNRRLQHCFYNNCIISLKNYVLFLALRQDKSNMMKYYALLLLAMLVRRAGAARRRRVLRADDISLRSIESSEFASSIGDALVLGREVHQDVLGGTERCSSPSKAWLLEKSSSIESEDLAYFFDNHLQSLPFAYKLYVADRDEDQNFGSNGKYTEQITQIHSKSQDFWRDSGAEDDIRLLGAHGEDLADRDKLIPTLKMIFGRSYHNGYTVEEHATEIQDLIERLPGGYSNPLLTFNAFFSNDAGAILIGDGYFEFQQSQGLESVGPSYAVTHEHAHHLQYALSDFDSDDTSSSDSRKKELMADALSAFFLYHDSGGDLYGAEIDRIYRSAYSVGDCEIMDEGHHGTPNERRCASMWGAELAASSDASIIDLLELKSRFNLWYDGLDYHCTTIDSSSASTSSRTTVMTLIMAGTAATWLGL